jgi:hypothetical protein
MAHKFLRLRDSNAAQVSVESFNCCPSNRPTRSGDRP